VSAPAALISDKSQFHEGIVAWSDELLAPYIATLNQRVAWQAQPAAEIEGGHLEPRRKEFNDSVWRTIILEPFEVVVLDSPLLQRLRRIKQLGVVDLVYPSAAHTRFEHTLGAVYQVTNLIDALLNDQLPSPANIDASWRNLLRLAALCHDVGHGALSHVSENALRNFSEAENVRLQFVDELGGAEPPSLSEIAAYYIVGSQSFRELLALCSQLVPGHVLPSDPASLVQQAIIGEPIRNDIPLLHELVSGPFDGDKLDYMTRDAHMTGVPVVTDIHRLIQKVRSTNVAQDDLPPELASRIPAGEPQYTLTGIALSGGRTLDELLIGKTLLHDKLYRHQKVRAAEAMVAAIFQQLGEFVEGGPALMGYRLEDADFFAIGEATVDLLRARGAPTESVEVAQEISRRLRDRDLFVRAYAFAQNMPLDPYRSEEDHWRGLNQLRLVAKKPRNRAGLVGEIEGEIRAVLAALGREAIADELPGTSLTPYMWIDPPAPPEQDEQGGEIVRAYLIGENGDWLRFRDDYAEAIGWSAAYPLTRDLGYLFTVPELAPYAFLATEKVVRQNFSVKTPGSVLPYAKQRAAEIEDIKRKLVDAGYYAGAPHDLRPPLPRLKKADVRRRVDAVVAALSGYEGPVREGHVGKQATLMNRERTLNWIKQFGTDQLADAALRTVEHVQFLRRHDLAESLTRLLENESELRDGSVVPLGEPKDSSAVLTYYANDVAGRYGFVSRYLGEALLHEGPILFVDDFIGTGSQAASIVEAWFGEKTIDLGEVRADALPPESRKLLSEKRLVFAFTAGRGVGKLQLEQRCRDFDLSAQVDIGIAQLKSINDDGLFESEGQRDAFLAHCRDVGGALLLDPEAGHDAEWAGDRELGYGNEGYLAVFPYNTPTATLTALWAAGQVDGVEWETLCPRRKKR
jgi:deoxynucleoside triphosphate triphosphohydrolase SAMHD1